MNIFEDKNISIFARYLFLYLKHTNKTYYTLKELCSVLDFQIEPFVVATFARELHDYKYIVLDDNGKMDITDKSKIVLLKDIEDNGLPNSKRKD